MPIIPAVKPYITQRAIPGGTKRNWAGYGDKVDLAKLVNLQEALGILPDPQTNGGLLISVDKEAVEEVQELLASAGLYHAVIGEMGAAREKVVYAE